MGQRAARSKQGIRDVVSDLQAMYEIGFGGDGPLALCPCHVGFDLFEEHVSVVNRLLRHPSRVVRREALHVFEDAFTLKRARDLRYSLEQGEEKIGEKRACHFRSMAERLEARRDREISKKKRRRSPRMIFR